MSFLKSITDFVNPGKTGDTEFSPSNKILNNTNVLTILLKPLLGQSDPYSDICDRLNLLSVAKIILPTTQQIERSKFTKESALDSINIIERTVASYFNGSISAAPSAVRFAIESIKLLINSNGLAFNVYRGFILNEKVVAFILISKTSVEYKSNDSIVMVSSSSVKQNTPIPPAELNFLFIVCTILDENKLQTGNYEILDDLITSILKNKCLNSSELKTHEMEHKLKHVKWLMNTPLTSEHS